MSSSGVRPGSGGEGVRPGAGGTGVAGGSDGTYLANTIRLWDFNDPTLQTVSDVNRLDSMVDSIGGFTLVRTGGQTSGGVPVPGSIFAPRLVTTLGSNGLTSVEITSTGSGDQRTATLRAQNAGLILEQPFGISLVVQNVNASAVYFRCGFLDNVPHAYTFGTWTMHAGAGLTFGASNTNPHIFYLEFNGASSRAFVDGVLIATGNAGAGEHEDRFDLNGTDSGINRFGECSQHSGIQDAADVTLEAQRLADKWGFTI